MTGSPRLKVIAHRGGAALRVENTLAAFEHAVELGADGAELDVHLSRDGQVVVHHDDTLNAGYCRIIDGAWIDTAHRPRIADLTFAQLQRYEIGVPRPGSDYARRYPGIAPVAGQRIPLLRDVIRRVKARSPRFQLVIEIKTPMADAARRPWQGLVAATLDVIRQEDFTARAILCSFDWGALAAAKRECPGLPTWFTTAPLGWFEAGTPACEDDPPDAAELQVLRTQYGRGDAPWYAGSNPHELPGGYPEAIADLGGDAWFMYDRDCTAERAHAASARGLLAATWGPSVRDRVDLARLVRNDVGAVCLDDPRIALGDPSLR